MVFLLIKRTILNGAQVYKSWLAKEWAKLVKKSMSRFNASVISWPSFLISQWQFDLSRGLIWRSFTSWILDCWRGSRRIFCSEGNSFFLNNWKWLLGGFLYKCWRERKVSWWALNEIFYPNKSPLATVKAYWKEKNIEEVERNFFDLVI